MENPFSLKVGQVFTGFGVGCGIGIGVGRPIYFGELLVWILNQITPLLSNSSSLDHGYEKFFWAPLLRSRCRDCTHRFFGSVRLHSFDDFPFFDDFSFLSDRKLRHFDRKKQRELAGCEGAIPVLQPVLSATRGATDALSGVGRHLKKLGIKRVEAGIGCGVGIGHGFGVGNMIKGKEKSNVSLRRDPSWKYSVQVDVGGEKTVEQGAYYGSESGKGSSSTINNRGACGPMDQYMVNPGEDRGQTQMMPAAGTREGRRQAYASKRLEMYNQAYQMHKYEEGNASNVTLRLQWGLKHFGAGIALKPWVLQQIQTSITESVMKIMMNMGLAPSSSSVNNFIPSSTQSGMLTSNLQASAGPSKTMLSTFQRSRSDGTINEIDSNIFGQKNTFSSTPPVSRTEKVVENFLQSSALKNEAEADLDETVRNLRTENNALQLLLKHQETIEKLMDENQKLHKVLIEDLKIPPDKLQANSGTIASSGYPCIDCFECRRRRRRKFKT
ncbi:hypothetical protein M5K25_007354 [Dendrobium thyrsiflorum]|uniref:Uncharacterized protein n=1 Tax=Dendrobium thyrsiflorum TaxID=117978 RepID=A0ABD0VLD1_DENTH